VQDFVENRAVTFAFKRQESGGHFVEHNTKGKKIAASIQRFPQNLFRRHVGNSAHRRAGACQLFGVLSEDCQRFTLSTSDPRRGYFREPEIQDFGVAPLGDENVRWLDVPVNDALGMRGIQSICNLNRNVKKPIEFDRQASDDVLESGTIQIFHCNEDVTILFADVMYDADIWMIQCRSGLSFSLESRQALSASGKIVGEKFQSNESVEASVLSLINHTHPAAAKLFDNAIMRDGLAYHGPPLFRGCYFE
jgi:hypothetical protein